MQRVTGAKIKREHVAKKEDEPSPVAEYEDPKQRRDGATLEEVAHKIA